MLGPSNVKSRGFTLLEVVVVIAIIAVLAALTTPAFVAAKSKAQETTCIANLRQIGIGLALYRSEQGLEAASGYPLRDMGLPPSGIVPGTTEHLKCRGISRTCNWSEDYYPVYYPPGRVYFDSEVEWQAAQAWWARYTEIHGDGAVTYYDDRHQHGCPLSVAEPKRAYKLLLSGAVQLVNRTGRLPSVPFWHGSNE